MTGIGFLFLQLAAAQAPAAPPDIEVTAHVRMRDVRVRQDGQARLGLHAEPGDAPPAKVERSAPAGAKHYRNLTIDLKGEAHLAASPTEPAQGNADESRQP